MNHALLALPIALSFLLGFVLASTSCTAPMKRTLLLGLTALHALLAIVLVGRAFGAELPVSRLGHWPAPASIVLWADPAGAFSYLLCSAGLLALLITRRCEESVGLCFFLGGLAVSCLTDDAFTLALGFSLCWMSLRPQDFSKVSVAFFALFFSVALLYGTFGMTNLHAIALKTNAFANSKKLFFWAVAMWTLGAWIFVGICSLLEVRCGNRSFGILSLVVLFVVLRFATLTFTDLVIAGTPMARFYQSVGQNFFTYEKGISAVMGTSNRIMRDPLQKKP